MSQRIVLRTGEALVEGDAAYLEGKNRMPLVTTYSRYLGDASLEGAISELAQAITHEPRLLAVGEAAASAPVASGKWSPKEILGHLIDSAGNNLQRFVRAQIPEHLTEGLLRLPSYAQDDWVRVQDYRSRPWNALVTLWTALNAHLLHILKHADRTEIKTECVIGTGAPVPLEHIMVDYVGHVKHHLKQVLGA